jgi:hypothetical protein
MKAGTGLVALMVCLVTIGCDPNPAGLTVGMEEIEGSAAVIHYSCGGELVVSVEIVDAHGENPGGNDDSMLWRISSPGVATPHSITVGEAPSGFVTDVPLRAPLRGAADLSLLLSTKAEPDKTPFTIAMGFSPDQLTPAQILTDEGKLIAREDFDARAAQACP